MPGSGDTNRWPASRHPQSRDCTHISCGNHAFFSVCPVSCLYTPPLFVMRFNYTQTDPERKRRVFSDDGYVFTVFNSWRSQGAHFLVWLIVFQSVIESGSSRNRSTLGGQGELPRVKGGRDTVLCVWCVFEFASILMSLHDTFIIHEASCLHIWREYDFTSREIQYILSTGL